LLTKRAKPWSYVQQPPLPSLYGHDAYFERYADEFKDKVLFARIDVNKNPYAANRYGIMATPTFSGGRPGTGDRGRDLPSLFKRITEEALEYGSTCSSRSTPIDFNIGTRDPSLSEKGRSAEKLVSGLLSTIVLLAFPPKNFLRLMRCFKASGHPALDRVPSGGSSWQLLFA
jgi:thioredoxin 1